MQVKTKVGVVAAPVETSAFCIDEAVAAIAEQILSTLHTQQEKGQAITMMVRRIGGAERALTQAALRLERALKDDYLA